MDLNLGSENNLSLAQIPKLQLRATANIFMLSDEFRQRLIFINLGVIGTTVSVFGIVVNVVNILVFTKQGFNDTVNISLAALALSDMASLIFVIWSGLCYNPELKPFLEPLETAQIIYLTGGQPRLYFSRLSSWITSLIAVERCVCVLRPLQVKLIFTKNRIVLILLLIMGIVFTTMVPVYYTSYLAWKFDPFRNRSYIGLIFTEQRQRVEKISFALGVTISLSAFFTVASCTCILGWSLVKQSQWRAKSMGATNIISSTSGVSNKSKSEIKTIGKKSNDSAAAPSSTSAILSNRDRQIVRTVTFIAALFVACYFPNAISLTTMCIVPEYNKGAKYENILLTIWSFAHLIESICSSANIFIYVKTSTRFKETFLSLMALGTSSKRENKK